MKRRKKSIIVEYAKNMAKKMIEKPAFRTRVEKDQKKEKKKRGCRRG